MIDQYVLATNDDGDLAIRTVSATESSSVTDTTSVITATDDGKLAVRVVGSGGGDQHNLGYYATPQALNEAYPTAEAGDWAIVGSTDTVWIWDTDTSAWVDSDQKGQVTSVNGQTGAVTVQETLVNQTNIKSVDGNSLLGSGNLELSTYLTYPAGWTTNSTTKAFCDDIAADTSAVVGKAYLGEVTLSDLPASMVNGEIVVEIMDGTTAANKVIILTLKSGNVSPYCWQYVYWNGGSNTSGWKTWQEPLVSGTNIKTVNGTSLLGSGDITTEAIQVSTMPAAAVGELGKVYQFIGTTDANYTHGYFYECVSDGGNPATYSWVQTNVQPAPSGLPSQSGNSGKFLTTDGTDASWSDKPLVNNSPNGTSLEIAGRSNTNYYESVCIGQSSFNGGEGGTSIGYDSRGSKYATAVGCRTEVNNEGGIAIGWRATVMANWAIQLGGYWKSNNVANTLKVGNGNGNYEMMSADGTIPTDRYTTTPSADGTYVPTLTISSGTATRTWGAAASAPVVPATAPTLAVNDWSSNTQTITVSGVTSSNVVLVGPAPGSAQDYADAGILCTAQSTDSLTFTCTTVPSNAITLSVVIFG